MIFWRFFNEEEKEEIGITDGEPRDRESNSVVVDALGVAIPTWQVARDWQC